MGKKTLIDLANAVQDSNFECEAGKLELHRDWQRLKKRLAKADKWKGIARAAIEQRAIFADYCRKLKNELIALGAYVENENSVFTRKRTQEKRRFIGNLPKPVFKPAPERPKVQPCPVCDCGHAYNRHRHHGTLGCYECETCAGYGVESEQLAQPEPHPFVPLERDHSDLWELHRILCRECGHGKNSKYHVPPEPPEPPKRAQILRIGHIEGFDASKHPDGAYSGCVGWQFAGFEGNDSQPNSNNALTRFGWDYAHLCYIAQTNWIPIAGQKPMRNQEVILLGIVAKTGDGRPVYRSAMQAWNDWHSCGFDVTHWRPFHAPEPLEVSA